MMGTPMASTLTSTTVTRRPAKIARLQGYIVRGVTSDSGHPELLRVVRPTNRRLLKSTPFSPSVTSQPLDTVVATGSTSSTTWPRATHSGTSLSNWSNVWSGLDSTNWTDDSQATGNNTSLWNTTGLNCSNASDLWTCNDTLDGNGVGVGVDMESRDYWALLLFLFPLLTVFGNVLVILSVYKERSLQTATNYFIISLAIADLLVATLVMPFAVYVMVNVEWGLPAVVCDFYIAMDVTCSTSSIFNLVAISIDRFIAVTQPLKYARHKNHKRVWLTIGLVWAISAAIGSPIVLGLNHTPSRDPTLCMFYNSDFVIYSSLSSFYIPCIIMVFLYYRIFKAIRARAKKQAANRKPCHAVASKRQAETTLGSTGPSCVRPVVTGSVEGGSSISPVNSILVKNVALVRAEEDEKMTDQGSGSQDEEEDLDDRDAEEPDGSEEGNVLPCETSTEYILTSESKAISKIALPPTPMNGDSNGNQEAVFPTSAADGIALPPRTECQRLKVATSVKSANNSEAMKMDSLAAAAKNKDNKTSSRFTIYKVNKASRKKREKSSAKKERKATKTLAIVLGVFLICWVPFFTCNIMDAICAKLQLDCTPGVMAFQLTTWLGYVNSFINPVIYTIFNMEFRKAFKRILTCK